MFKLNGKDFSETLTSEQLDSAWFFFHGKDSKYNDVPEDVFETLWLGHFGQDYFEEALACAREGFRGHFENPGDYAAQMFDGSGVLETIPTNIARYIDFEAMERDMELNSEIIRIHTRGWVFVFDGSAR